MTWMDEQHYDNEQVAYNSTRHLQLWLATIAPIGGDISVKVQDALTEMIKELKWETEYDVVIGINLLK